VAFKHLVPAATEKKGGNMGRFSLATLAFVLGASLLMGAQAAAVRGDTRLQAAKGVDLAGQVSKDGKMLGADDDNTWTVNNVEALKGFTGRHVTVKCRMDLNKHAIRILYVIQPIITHSANLNDSAFRR